jgi:hypothetical protein
MDNRLIVIRKDALGAEKAWLRCEPHQANELFKFLPDFVAEGEACGQLTFAVACPDLPLAARAVAAIDSVGGSTEAVQAPAGGSESVDGSEVGGGAVEVVAADPSLDPAVTARPDALQG